MFEGIVFFRITFDLQELYQVHNSEVENDIFSDGLSLESVSGTIFVFVTGNPDILKEVVSELENISNIQVVL